MFEDTPQILALRSYLSTSNGPFVSTHLVLQDGPFNEYVWDVAHGEKMDTLGFEPRAFRMRSGCDTTTPCALAHTESMYLALKGMKAYIQAYKHEAIKTQSN
jgi:hypothetical protein